MKRNNVDEKIKQMLLQDTEIDEALKEATWEKINEQIQRQEKPERSSKKKKRFISIVIAAAVMLLVVGMMTETGRAMIQNIKDTFVPNKQVEIEIEGQKEPSNVQLEMNEQLDYVIYIDEDYYQMEEVDGVDRVIPKEPLGDMYPEVYMEISERNAIGKDDLLTEIEEQINKDGASLINREEVSEPIKATMLYALESDYVQEGEIIDLEWDAIVHRYYVIFASVDKAYIVKQQFFTEAEEGHGARFDAMLEGFEIIDVNDNEDL